MKKFISIFLSVCLVLTVISAGFVFANAEKITSTDIEWSFDNTTKILSISGKGAIPDYSYSGGLASESTAPWKGIDYETITFSDGITSIGKYAFCYSKYLKAVNLPDTVTAVGAGAFFNCNKVESASLSDKITVIPEKLFEGCSDLKNVKLPNKTESIGNRAFYSTDIESIALPETLKSIGSEAFSNCSNLTGAVMPKALESIGASAFSACGSLKSIELNQGLKTIGNSAFSWCVELKAISIPSSVSAIPENLFDYGSSLTDVVIADGVKSIGEKAFFRCSSLKKITVPGSVESIGEKALGYSKALIKTDGFTITGYEDSQAKTYADSNKFSFESLGTYYSGSLGEKTGWSFDSKTKTLTISGSGAMEGEYDAENLPIYIKRFPQIDNIVISEEIIFIADYAFFNLGKDCKIAPLNSISIGEYAFFNTGSCIELSPRVKVIAEKGIGQYDADGKADSEFKVIGTKFSFAQAFAEENGFKFELSSPAVLSGKCGDNAEWSFNPETGELTVSGSGDIYSYTQSSLPEYSYYDVKSITISTDITSVGDYAFFGLEKTTQVLINPSIVSIGEKSFGYTFDKDGNPAVIDGFTVFCSSDSAAFDYAEKNGLTYSFTDLFALPESLSIVVDEENKTIFVYDNQMAKDTFINACTVGKECEVIISDDTICTDSTLEVKIKNETVDKFNYTFIVNGDVNCDGAVNSTDALLILLHTVKKTPLTGNCLEAGKMDSDTEVNSSDALLALQISVNQITPQSLLPEKPQITE